MNYELLKKEFSHLSSFLIWDNERVRNGLPPCFDDKEYRKKNFKPSYIYLAMNLRTDDEDFYRLYESFSVNVNIRMYIFAQIIMYIFLFLLFKNMVF